MSVYDILMGLINPKSIPSNTGPISAITKLAATASQNQTNVAAAKNAAAASSDPRRESINNQRDQANPNYAAIMAASDPRRESIDTLRGINNTPVTKPTAPAAPVYDGPSGPDTYKYSGPSAASMATSEFGPQFALLAQQQKQATGAYNKAGTDVGNMYDSLARAMHGDTATIQGQYAKTGNSIGEAYNSAIANTDQGFSNSRQEISDLAQRLGVTQGIPSALQGGSEQQGRLDALLNSNKANSMTTNTQLGQNDVSYNNQQANNQTAAGINARSDFKNRLLTALQGYSNQGLTLKGNQGQAQNKYGMDIANLMQQGQSNLNDNFTKQQSNRISQQQNAWQEEIARAGAMTGQQNADTNTYRATHPNSTATTPKLNAYQTLADSANQIYPGDVHSQQKATQIISDMINNGSDGNVSFTSAGDFVRRVMTAHPEMDGAKIQQLASIFYSNFVGGTGKRYDG